jgi:hypothetical protein
MMASRSLTANSRPIFEWYGKQAIDFIELSFRGQLTHPGKNPPFVENKRETL